MTTLNVIRACGHFAPAYETTQPESARQYVEETRNSYCDLDECQTRKAEGTMAVRTWIDGQKDKNSGKYVEGQFLNRFVPSKPVRIAKAGFAQETRYAQAPAELWTRNDGRLIVLQNIAGDRETRRILEAQGFTRIGSSARATIKAALAECIPGDTLIPHLESADEWIADNVTADHTHHVAACGHVTGPCSDLTCFVREYPDPCAECRRIAAIEQADAAKQREHTQHICAECGDLTPAVGTFGRPCSKTLEEHDNGAHYCYACKTTVSAFPVGILADRPIERCEIPDCVILAVFPSKRCRVHHCPLGIITCDMDHLSEDHPDEEETETVLECDRRGELVEPAVTVWDVQAEAEAVAQAAQDAPQAATMPVTARTCGRATCDTRAHTAGGWRKRGMTPARAAVPFERDGWQLYCRHQVEAVEPARL